MIDLHPFTLLVSVFVVLAIKHTVQAIGKSQIEAFLWKIYCSIAPKLGHAKLNTISAKQQEAFTINKERKAISAQDHYARWTKLNRQYDKLTEEIKGLNEQVAGEKAQVSKVLGLLITALTTAPIWFFRVWFRKSVLFYLPPGVFPYPLERLLAIPFVPLGGLGLTVWMFASNSVLQSLIFMVKFPFEESVEKPVKQEAGSVEEVKEEKVN